MYVNSDVIGSNNVSLDSVREGEHLIIPIFKLQSYLNKIDRFFVFDAVCYSSININVIYQNMCQQDIIVTINIKRLTFPMVFQPCQTG